MIRFKMASWKLYACMVFMHGSLFSMDPFNKWPMIKGFDVLLLNTTETASEQTKQQAETQTELQDTLNTYARLGKSEEIIQLLEEHPTIDINLPTFMGNTPLLIAAEHDQKEVVALLIQRGAYVDLKNARGTTLLHWAAYHEFYELVQIFQKEDRIPPLAAYNPYQFPSKDRYSPRVKRLSSNEDIFACYMIPSEPGGYVGPPLAWAVEGGQYWTKLILETSGIKDEKEFYRLKEGLESGKYFP